MRTRGRTAILVAAVVAGVLALVVGVSRSETQPGEPGRSPARLTAHSAATKHFE